MLSLSLSVAGLLFLFGLAALLALMCAFLSSSAISSHTSSDSLAELSLSILETGLALLASLSRAAFFAFLCAFFSLALIAAQTSSSSRDVSSAHDLARICASSSLLAALIALMCIFLSSAVICSQT
jgi:hypothetical protein